MEIFRFRRRFIDSMDLPLDPHAPHSKKYILPDTPGINVYLDNISKLCSDEIESSVKCSALEGTGFRRNNTHKSSIILSTEAYKQLKPQFDTIVSKAIEMSLQQDDQKEQD